MTDANSWPRTSVDMQDKWQAKGKEGDVEPYNTWILRYVPDPVRGEFVNIGVIAGLGEDWAVERVHNFRHAARLGGQPKLLQPWLRRFEQLASPTNVYMDYLDSGVAGEPERWTDGLVRDLSARMNNALRIDAVPPTMAVDAKSAAALMFSLVVLDTPSEERMRRKTRMIKSFRHALLQNWGGDRTLPLLAKPKVSLGRQRQRFDLGLHNSKVLQLTQAVSFKRSSLDQIRQEVNAWNYQVLRIRDNGGEVAAKEHSWNVPNDVAITVVHDEPPSSESRDIFLDAAEGWKNLEVDFVSDTHVEEAADKALELIPA